MSFFTKKSALALIVVSTLLFSLAACEDDTPEVKVYSDRVYVSDHLFISTGDNSDTLPDGYTSIGTVETLLSKTEPVESNKASNCLEVGSDNITSPYAMLSISAFLTLALIQMRNFSFLLDNTWLGVYFGSVLLMLLAIGIMVIQFKHMEERCYGA